MSLSNAQYDTIMRIYDKKQLHNQHLYELKKQAAFQKDPRLAQIDDEIVRCSVTQAKKRLEGNMIALSELKTQLRQLREERARLLEQLHLPNDYFAPIYSCNHCQDTGFINGKYCQCFKQEIINVVYSQSNIRNILERENFSTFSYDFYDENVINKTTGLSSLATIQKAVAECKHFISDFDNKPKNIFLYGDTGVGKTFLTNCVAKELLDKGYSVIYFTAFQLFDILSKGVFSKNEDAIAANRNIFDCDLLIIDDLGTELTNSFTTSQLFLCVNERILRQKSTIISTNLNMNQMVDLYSERTLSRISSNYSVIKLFGEDIRIKKRKMH